MRQYKNLGIISHREGRRDVRNDNGKAIGHQCDSNGKALQQFKTDNECFVSGSMTNSTLQKIRQNATNNGRDN